MTQRTVQPPPAQDQGQHPLDVETMRKGARRLLAADVEPPTAAAELRLLTAQLRGHVAAAAPDVETLALALPEEDVPRACALACVGEARQRFHQQPDDTLDARLALAQGLAHVVNALADHYENLGGSDRDGVSG
ncbi:DUF6415 family natural product biosynthesis protein [Streptomyces mirabilis]|uniref:DUF6415 family natural product biosynthesis protein n=1 Tax=Streptomyces mirabilis TaxID=68239 RepID=UPI00364DC5DB